MIYSSLFEPEVQKKLKELQEKISRKRSGDNSVNTKDFIVKKLIRGENRKDKMFKNVKLTLENAKNLFK